jgi:tetratricopeptide (TPR) repeat protein
MPLLGTAALALATVLSASGQDAGDDPASLFRQAQELARAQKYDEAVAVLRQVLRLAPRNDLYLATASECELKAGKYADGLAHALEAVRLNDKVGAYYVLVAASALGDQDLDRAREYCDLVLKRGPQEFGAGACNDARALQHLLLPRTFTLFWNLDPQKGKAVNGVLAVALPRTDLPYQSTTYEIGGVRSHRLVKGEVNDVLHVVPDGTKPFALTTRVTLKPYSFKEKLARAVRAARQPLPADARACLGPCATIDPRSPVLLKAAAGLKAERAEDTARNVLGWMKKHVEYRLEKTKIAELDFKSVDELVERGHAECKGYTMLFTGLCRAAGVPARSVWGLTTVQPGQDRRFGDIASHNWAEFYVAGCGWVPVDPQRPETVGFLPTNIIRIVMDTKTTAAGAELLPMFNLVAMNGDQLRFEESR